MDELRLMRQLLLIALGLEVVVLAVVLGWLAVSYWRDWRDGRWLRRHFPTVKQR